MERAPNRLTVLGRAECLDLLRAGVVGRVAVCLDALPAVFPVAYGMLGDDIVFRAARGSKLRAAAAQAIVAFEVGEFDAEMQQGWSVLVTGSAKELSDPDDIAAAEALWLPAWEAEEPGRWLRVRTQMLNGRRMATAAVLTPR